jgi:hypothetical protein
MEESAFSECQWLSGVLLETTTSFSISASSFEKCRNLTTLEVICQRVGPFAFFGCSALKSVRILGHFLDDFSFAGCPFVSSLVIEDPFDYTNSTFEGTGVSEIQYLKETEIPGKKPFINTPKMILIKYPFKTFIRYDALNPKPQSGLLVPIWAVVAISASVFFISVIIFFFVGERYKVRKFENQQSSMHQFSTILDNFKNQ